MTKLPPDYIYHHASYYKLLKKLDGTLNKILAIHRIKQQKVEILSESYSESVPLVVKSSKRKYFIKIADKEPIANEVYLYRLARKFNLGFPKLLYYDLSRKRIQFTYEIVEFIEGVSPYEMSSRILYNAGIFAGMQLKKIHQIGVKGFGSVDDKFKWRCNNWLKALEVERKSVNNSMARKVFSQNEIYTVDELTLYNKAINIKHPKLLHGDLWEGNVLYLKDPRKFLITDAGTLIGGDPMFDIAYSTAPRTPPFEKGIAEGYGLNDITEKDMYRLNVLRAFCLFKEAIDYFERKDTKFKINMLAKAFRSEIAKIV
jgi:fructosamine-3-kinase